MQPYAASLMTAAVKGMESGGTVILNIDEFGAGSLKKAGYTTSPLEDGTLAGYDIGLTRAISEAVTVPVIASGGAGTLDHLVDAVSEGGADAVLCASIFHYGEFTVGQAKAYMAQQGIPMRDDA